MKKAFIVLAVLLILGIGFTGCSGSFFANDGLVIARTALGPGWNSYVDPPAGYSLINIDPRLNTTRSDASGMKITSNAHSFDFPGIVFVWDEKQKDNAYLKVDARIFSKYVYFIITIKEGSTYYDYRIEPPVGGGWQLTYDECYIISIPKQKQGINMVFIDEWHIRKFSDNPPNVLVTPDVSLGKYVIISTPGNSVDQPAGTNAYEVDPSDFLFLPDAGENVDVKKYWNSGMQGAFDQLQTIANSNDKKATWIWDCPEPWIYGETGAQTVVFASRFNIPVDPALITGDIPFYFACDYAAAVYVNGILAGKTEWAFEGLDGKYQPWPQLTDPVNGTDWSFDNYALQHFRDTGSDWQVVYDVNIKPLLVEGFNEIAIIAANSDKDGPDKFNNPAGLIFGCEFSLP